MNYHYGQHQWHSEYQKLCRSRDPASLAYVARDCYDAFNANPDNPKCSQYMDESLYCMDELRRRGITLQEAEHG